MARAIFTFGDSIMDAGNNHFVKNCTAQADFPPYGSTFFHRPTRRFINGRTVPDFICSNDAFNFFLLFGGPSVGLDAYMASMLAEVGAFVDRIYKLGARRVALFSLGLVGCVPARVLLGGPANRYFSKMNKIVKNYNKGLESLVKDVIPLKYKGMLGVYGAMYDLVRVFQAMPTRYGFKDVTSACCGVGSLGGEVQCEKEGYKICPNPNEFLFWDYFHPSEHIYHIIAKVGKLGLY